MDLQLLLFFIPTFATHHMLSKEEHGDNWTHMYHRNITNRAHVRIMIPTQYTITFFLSTTIRMAATIVMMVKLDILPHASQIMNSRANLQNMQSCSSCIKYMPCRIDA